VNPNPSAGLPLHAAIKTAIIAKAIMATMHSSASAPPFVTVWPPSVHLHCRLSGRVLDAGRIPCAGQADQMMLRNAFWSRVRPR
jgi:hypothetical protein